MFIFFKRVLSFAGKSFWRNLGLSLTTILILVMTLISFNVVFSVGAMTDAAVRLVEKRIDISLLFKVDAPNEKIDELRLALSKMPVVGSVVFKTREEVLADFKAKHAQDAEILSALEELRENPLGATLIIRAKTTKDYEQILTVIDIPEYSQWIEEKTFEDHTAIIKKIGEVTGQAQKFAIATSMLLMIITFLIIFNVIRVTIYTHREEISVMRLVGASNWFIRLPFLLEVVFYSFLSVLISTSLLYVGLHFGDSYVKNFFNGTHFSLTGYFNSRFLQLFGGEFLALAVLGILSALLAMRRYLKV